MRLVRLEELKDRKPFDCGDEDLNGFFCDDAAHYQKEMEEEDSPTIPMYYDLKELAQ